MAALDRRLQRLTLAAMCLGQGMILLDNTIVNVALPSIQAELGVTPGNLEWVVNAYVLALAALILVGGTLGDRFGRRRVFVTGLAVFTAGSAACALSVDDPQLIAFRAIQGAGAALMAPLALSIIVDAYPDQRQRTGAIGIWAAAAGLGFSAGPIIGGVLIELFDWSAIFWVNVPAGIVTGVLTLAVVRESRNPDARRLDPLGAALAAAAMFLLTFALIGTNEHPWGSARTIALLAAAALLLAAFLAWQRRAPAPMIELGLFRSRTFVTGSVVYGLAYLSLAGMFFFITLYLQNVRGWTALETGLSWIPLNVPFLIVSPFAGRIVRAFGSAATCTVGALLAAAGPGHARGDRDRRPVRAARGRLRAARARLRAARARRPGRDDGGGAGRPRRRRLGDPQRVAPARGGRRARDPRVDRRRRGRALVVGPDSVLQQVAGGEVAAGHHAFMAGLHAGLWTATAALLAAAALAVIGLRRPAPR